MDCRLCTDELTAYLDGELSEADEARIRRHLEACPPCQDELQAMRGAADFIESHIRNVEPVPEIWNNLRARIAAMPAPAERSGFFQLLVVNRWGAMLATLASTAVLAVGIWGYLAHQASDKALESYMNDYILERSVAERLYTVQIRQWRNLRSEAGVAWIPVSENPFVDQRSVSLANPFASEER